MLHGTMARKANGYQKSETYSLQNKQNVSLVF